MDRINVIQTVVSAAFWGKWVIDRVNMIQTVVNAAFKDLRQPVKPVLPEACNGAQGHYCNSRAYDMLEIKRAFFVFF